jgi:hypothetical protein
LVVSSWLWVCDCRIPSAAACSWGVVNLGCLKRFDFQLGRSSQRWFCLGMLHNADSDMAGQKGVVASMDLRGLSGFCVLVRRDFDLGIGCQKCNKPVEAPGVSENLHKVTHGEGGGVLRTASMGEIQDEHAVCGDIGERRGGACVWGGGMGMHVVPHHLLS